MKHNAPSPPRGLHPARAELSNEPSPDPTGSLLPTEWRHLPLPSDIGLTGPRGGNGGTGVNPAFFTHTGVVVLLKHF